MKQSRKSDVSTIASPTIPEKTLQSIIKMFSKETHGAAYDDLPLDVLMALADREGKELAKSMKKAAELKREIKRRQLHEARSTKMKSAGK